MEYGKHIGFFENMGLLTGDGKRDAYFYNQAQEMHCLSVMQAIGDLQTDILILGQKIGLEEAYHQLVFGAARRSKILWTAFRQLYRLISPDRTSPLPLDDVFEAARALNDIYIHLRGMQDNYAWALLYLFGGDASKQLNQGDVSLFSKKFTNVQPIAEFVDIVKPFSDWNTELKAMRDPVAHRIPLSVPPAILDEADQKKYAEVNELYNAAQSRFFVLCREPVERSEIDAASAEVESFHEQLQGIGKFAPVIVHDPKEGGTNIYPTVPQDIGMIVKLARLLNSRIESKVTT